MVGTRRQDREQKVEARTPDYIQDETGAWRTAGKELDGTGRTGSVRVATRCQEIIDQKGVRE